MWHSTRISVSLVVHHNINIRRLQTRLGLAWVMSQLYRIKATCLPAGIGHAVTRAPWRAVTPGKVIIPSRHFLKCDSAAMMEKGGRGKRNCAASREADDIMIRNVQGRNVSVSHVVMLTNYKISLRTGNCPLLPATNWGRKYRLWFKYLILSDECWNLVENCSNQEKLFTWRKILILLLIEWYLKLREGGYIVLNFSCITPWFTKLSSKNLHNFKQTLRCNGIFASLKNILYVVAASWFWSFIKSG